MPLIKLFNLILFVSLLIGVGAYLGYSSKQTVSSTYVTQATTSSKVVATNITTNDTSVRVKAQNNNYGCENLTPQDIATASTFTISTDAVKDQTSVATYIHGNYQASYLVGDELQIYAPDGLYIGKMSEGRVTMRLQYYPYNKTAYGCVDTTRSVFFSPNGKNTLNGYLWGNW